MSHHPGVNLLIFHVWLRCDSEEFDSIEASAKEALANVLDVMPFEKTWTPPQGAHPVTAQANSQHITKNAENTVEQLKIAFSCLVRYYLVTTVISTFPRISTQNTLQQGPRFSAENAPADLPGRRACAGRRTRGAPPPRRSRRRPTCRAAGLQISLC